MNAILENTVYGCCIKVQNPRIDVECESFQTFQDGGRRHLKNRYIAIFL